MQTICVIPVILQDILQMSVYIYNTLAVYACLLPAILKQGGMNPGLFIQQLSCISLPLISSLRSIHSLHERARTHTRTHRASYTGYLNCLTVINVFKKIVDNVTGTEFCHSHVHHKKENSLELAFQCMDPSKKSWVMCKG